MRLVLGVRVPLSRDAAWGVRLERIGGRKVCTAMLWWYSSMCCLLCAVFDGVGVAEVSIYHPTELAIPIL